MKYRLRTIKVDSALNTYQQRELPISKPWIPICYWDGYWGRMYSDGSMRADTGAGGKGFGYMKDGVLLPPGHRIYQSVFTITDADLVPRIDPNIDYSILVQPPGQYQLYNGVTIWGGVFYYLEVVDNG
jgi:hypothetical protein